MQAIKATKPTITANFERNSGIKPIIDRSNITRITIPDIASLKGFA